MTRMPPESGPDSYGQRPPGAEASSQGKTRKIRQAADENEKLKAIVDRADRFHGLTEDPAYQELFEVVKEKREWYCNMIAKQIMNGIDLDMKSIRRTSDRLAGADWILSNPAGALKSLEEASLELLLRQEDTDQED